jgi:DNA-binding phage protein
MSHISRMLKRIIEKEALSIRGVSRAIGVDHASLSRSLKNDGNPEAKTVEKILNYLGYGIRIVKPRKQVGNKSKERRTTGE